MDLSASQIAFAIRQITISETNPSKVVNNAIDLRGEDASISSPVLKQTVPYILCAEANKCGDNASKDFRSKCINGHGRPPF